MQSSQAPRITERPSSRRAVAAMDVMRPTDAFATGPAARLADPLAWLRPTLAIVAAAAALAVLLGAGGR